MAKIICGSFRAILILGLFLLNTVCCSLILYLLGLIKWVFGKFSTFDSVDGAIDGLLFTWSRVNNFFIKFFIPTIIECHGVLDFSMDQSYLLVANHQSWADIMLLHLVFTRTLPPMKFFFKRELLWAPFIGVGCWIAGFPIMRRYSSEYMRQHPKAQGQDITVARKACQRFKKRPATIVNFCEGTRFRDYKWEKQQSPYQHLLCPRAGGVALVINAMEESIQQIIDVTIHYPKHPVSFWHFLCGYYDKVTILIEKKPIPTNIRGDYSNDPAFRAVFQAWLNQLWQDKDNNLIALQRNKVS